MTIRTWLADRRGVAGLEFGLVFMILFLLIVGAFELAQGWATLTKVKGLADSVAQIVAMEDTLNTSGGADVCTGAKMMIRPFDSTKLGVEIGQVTFNSSGAPAISWRYNACAANGTTDLTKPVSGLPTTAGVSYVVVRVTYVFTSPLTMFVPVPITMRGDAVANPRFGKVSWS